MTTTDTTDPWWTRTTPRSPWVTGCSSTTGAATDHPASRRSRRRRPRPAPPTPQRRRSAPGHVIRLDPFPADAEEPDWFHDSIGNRWVGPVGDGTIVVEIFGDELALLQAAVRQAADFPVAHVELFTDTTGDHRWRAVARNGEIVATSGRATGTLPTPGPWRSGSCPASRSETRRPTVTDALRAAGWTPEGKREALRPVPIGSPQPVRW